MNRIRTSLVPYLAQQKDRFFGSILVLVEGNSLEFEPLEQIITQNLPAAYRDSAERLGFVTINEGEHIALDGQHRLLAFREVITSGENLGEFASQVGEDEVCVLLLEFEDKKKTRRIFNNVNRHAKPTGRSDNIITSEDDGVAIVTRWLLDQDRNAPLASREIDGKDSELVNWTSNTLGQNSRHLTTISTVYETAKSILKLHQFEGFDMAKNPGNSELAARIASYELAYRMQTEATEAVDVGSEPRSIQKLYGLDDKRTEYFGRQCLLTRRLLERGVRFVQLYSGGGPDSWDAHVDVPDNHGRHSFEIDQPIAALMADLKRQGMWDQTLLIWGGEFGRTPTSEGVNKPGRDHNHYGFTMWLAGGGVKGGQAHGATDDFGFQAVTDKVHIHDLHATILNRMGLDHERLTYRYAGRDFRLTDVHGRVVQELLG